MTQLQWQTLESMLGEMTVDDKQRLSALLQQPAPQAPSEDRSLGLFADEPELMERIMEGVDRDRESRPFRIVD